MKTNRSDWAVFFNQHAPLYEDHCFTKNTLAEVDFLIDILGLSPGMSLIDVGCGTGRHSIELARRGIKVTGVDISRGMLDVARGHADKAHVEVRWIEADATRFQSDTKHDAAICLCEGSFGLLGRTDDPIEQPSSILRSIAGAVKSGSPILFTVLNGYAIARKHSNESVQKGLFDPLTLTEQSDCPLPGETEVTILRERGFVPTELRLLFHHAGVRIEHIWGGTAGNWGKRPIDLDEIELMVLGRA
jgi:cyclopropane fatty-acyl-phospholipid synthase-like methyltransferase